MKPRQAITLGLALSISAAHGAPPKGLPTVIPSVIPAIPPRSLPAVGLLPEGSNLQGVIIPRYDKEKHLVATLRAELMTVVTREEIEAIRVKLEMFGPDGANRGEVAMERATYNHANGMIRANDPVEVSTPTMRASGSGLVIQRGSANSSLEGFLLGPVMTSFYADRRTSMNRPASLTSIALVCLALTDPLLAAGPVPLMPEELAAIDLQVAQAQMPDHAEDSARILAAGEERSRAATASMQAFAKRSSVTIDLPAPAVDAAAAGQAAPQAAAEQATAGEAGITVQSDGGMYFDAAKNVIVYTKNIRLDEARFQLACDDQLQVFLTSEPKKPKPGAEGEKAKEVKAEAKDDGGLMGMGGASISGIDRIIATGNVKVTSKDPQGNAITASAQTAVYEAQTGAFILKGGLPQIQRGPSYQRALEPGIYIRYTKDGNFEMSEGKKKTFFVLPEKKK